MSSAAASPTGPLGGHDLDARFAPLLGVKLILGRIGPTTLCAIHPEEGRPRGFWLDELTLSFAADWVERRNAAGRNIYFTLNEPVAGRAKKPAKTQIISLRGFATDNDAKNGRSLDEAFDAIGCAGIAPNMIIATGGGFQPIWTLHAPLPATDENVRRVEAIGKRIVRLTGSDAVQNVDRILRLPFTKNFPNKIKIEAGRTVCLSGLVLPGAEGLMNSQILDECVWSSRRHTIEEIEEALDRAEEALGLGLPIAEAAAATGHRGNTAGNLMLPGAPAAVFRPLRGSPMTASASAGLAPRDWVEVLLPAEKDELAWKIAQDPAMEPLADSKRSIWLQGLFGFAALGTTGAPGARDAARAWSKTSARRYGSDAEFDKDWYSFDPNRTDAITVGTLIHHAEAVGVDLGPWRDLTRARSNSSTAIPPYTQKVSIGGGTANPHLLRNPFTPPAPPFFSPIRFDPSHLHPVSWLVLNLLLLGEVSVLVGQGAGAKTALAIHIAVSLAAGRSQIGPIWVKSYPEGLSIAFISAEEDPNRLGLLVAAACNSLNHTSTERALVTKNLKIHDAQKSGWMLGRPQQHDRDRIVPESEDQALQELIAALSAFDLLILDNLAGLFFLPDERNNHVITLLMERLTRAARQANCAVLLLHHTPKMTREAAAAQRGEATLARGGGAITARARVALTLTPLTVTEALGFVVQGYQADRIRRLEHGKVNDIPPMEPLYLATMPVDVEVFDGTKHPYRAIEFIRLPPNGGITNAVRNVVMKAVQDGIKNNQGARVALSPSKGRGDRGATPVIGKALQRANGSLTEAQAEALGRNVLGDLIESGCVEVTDVPIPQYRPDGRPNGTQRRRGLVARWDLAPWSLSGAGRPQPDGSPQVPSADPVEAPSDGNAGPAEQSPNEPVPGDAEVPPEQPGVEASQATEATRPNGETEPANEQTTVVTGPVEGNSC